jgi:hypothetical protein
MKTFYCTNCGFIAAFETVTCGNCTAQLGFVPEELDIFAFAPEDAGAWRRIEGEEAVPDGRRWRRCANHASVHVCNWMVLATDDEALCRSCRCTPRGTAIRKASNARAWLRLENAKRQLFHSLLRLGLPIEGDGRNLPPCFVMADDDTPAALHADPEVIRVEAGDAAGGSGERREEGGPSLLRRLRRDIGRYYWHRLIEHGPQLGDFRTLFGDERTVGADGDRSPLEHWSDAWADYLLISDILDTAGHWGFALHGDMSEDSPADLPEIGGSDQPFRQVLLEQWQPLAQFLNGIARDLGQGEVCSSSVANDVLDRLVFVHRVVEQAAGRGLGGEP